MRTYCRSYPQQHRTDTFSLSSLPSLNHAESCFKANASNIYLSRAFSTSARLHCQQPYPTVVFIRCSTYGSSRAGCLTEFIPRTLVQDITYVRLHYALHCWNHHGPTSHHSFDSTGFEPGPLDCCLRLHHQPRLWLSFCLDEHQDLSSIDQLRHLRYSPRLTQRTGIKGSSKRI